MAGKTKPKSAAAKRREALRREVEQNMQRMARTPAYGSSGAAGRKGQ